MRRLNLSVAMLMLGTETEVMVMDCKLGNNNKELQSVFHRTLYKYTQRNF